MAHHGSHLQQSGATPPYKYGIFTRITSSMASKRIRRQKNCVDRTFFDKVLCRNMHKGSEFIFL